MSNPNILLQKVSGALCYRETALAAFPKRLVEFLKIQGVLERTSTSEWFCEVCTDVHPVVELEQKRLKACPEDPTAFLTPVLPEELTQWHWNWERLKSNIQEANLLSPWTGVWTWPGVLPIGGLQINQKTGLVFLCEIHDASALRVLAEQLHARYPDSLIHIISTGMFPLDALSQAALNNLNAQHQTFTAMVETNWQIPWPGEEVEHYAMVLDCPNRCIQILGSVIPITKDYLVLTARILTRARGGTVSESEFNDQYYKTNTAFNQDTGVNLRKYCSLLNADIKAVLGELAPEDQVFKSVRNQGYQLNKKYLPVKIIE